MQLAYHYTLCAVYNESPLGRHQGDFTHIDFLFLRAFFFAQLERNMERRAVGLSFPLRLSRGQFRLADFTLADSKHRLFAIALDWEPFCQDSLEPWIFPLR